MLKIIQHKWFQKMLRFAVSLCRALYFFRLSNKKNYFAFSKWSKIQHFWFSFSLSSIVFFLFWNSKWNLKRAVIPSHSKKPIFEKKFCQDYPSYVRHSKSWKSYRLGGHIISRQCLLNRNTFFPSPIISTYFRVFSGDHEDILNKIIQARETYGYLE